MVHKFAFIQLENTHVKSPSPQVTRRVPLKSLSLRVISHEATLTWAFSSTPRSFTTVSQDMSSTHRTITAARCPICLIWMLMVPDRERYMGKVYASSGKDTDVFEIQYLDVGIYSGCVTAW